ncbi:MAG: hypothetical protein JST80_05350 [Bdellovibrionales bacterium]|nr:hypothetical protein [Bdellovibrionales bacterium]
MTKLSSLIITTSLLLGASAYAQGPKGNLTPKQQAQQKTKEELIPNQSLAKNTSREAYVYAVIRDLKEKILKKYSLDPKDVIDPATLGHAPYQVVDKNALHYIDNPGLSAKSLAAAKDQWNKLSSSARASLGRPSYLVVDPASVRYIDDKSINSSELNAWKKRWNAYRTKIESTWAKLSPGEQEKIRKLNKGRVEDSNDFGENWYFDKNGDVRISRVSFDDAGRRFRPRFTCENTSALLVNAKIKFDIYEVQASIPFINQKTGQPSIVWAPIRYEMVGELNNKSVTAWLTPKNGSDTQFIIERNGDFAGGGISIDTFNPRDKQTIVTLPMRYRGKTYWGQEEIDFLDEMDGAGKEYNGKYRYANSSSDQKLICKSQVDYLYVLDDDGTHDQDKYNKKDDRKKQTASKPDVKTLAPVVVKAIRKKTPEGNGGAKEPSGDKNGNSPTKPKDPRPPKEKMDELNNAYKKGSKEGLTDAFKKMQQDPEWAEEAIKRPVENFSTYTEYENKYHLKIETLSEDAFNDLKKVQRGFKKSVGIPFPNPWARPHEGYDSPILEELELGAKPIDGPELNGKTWKRIPTPTPSQIPP